MINATLTGNLGRDPEIRYLDNGQQVANFSVAVRQPKRKGEDAEAFWVKVEVWGKSAEYAANYLKKGGAVCCAGVLAQEEWTDKSTGELRRSLVLKNASVEGWTPKAEGSAQSPADEEVPF